MPENMFECFGQVIMVLRNLKGLSQAELAQLAGIKATQVSRYETGQVLPQLPQVSRLLSALGVGLPEFFYTLLHVKRIAHFVEEEAGRLPAETIARDSLMGYWREVTEGQLEVAGKVRRLIEEELGSDESGQVNERDERVRKAQEELKRYR